MTVSYSRHVATSRVGTFARLLFRWRGSIYKLIYRELIIFLTLYTSISLLYRFYLTQDQRHQFEQFALFCERTVGMIPITFILGFYVSLVVGRWWSIFTNITYPDRLLLQVSCWLVGTDERARLCRRTIARYSNLAQLLVFRDISSAVRKRFPSMAHLIEAGFMTDEELKLFESVEMSHHKFWMPLQWICSLLYASRKENRIENDQFVVRMVNEVLTLRCSIMTLLNYDWVSVPLVYSQVVTIAVYSYFLTSIFGHQYLDPSKHYTGHEVDMYFPLFTLLQFIFYLGWLKVAESIMNPLGEDDDDFEVNYLIERNLRVSYAMADDNCMKIPPLKRDMYWNEPETVVPHTLESAGLKDNPHIPSATEPPLSQPEVARKYSNLSIASSAIPDGQRSPNPAAMGLLSTFSKGKLNIRRVLSNVSHSMHRSDSHGLNDLLEEEPLERNGVEVSWSGGEDGNVVHGGDSSEFLSPESGSLTDRHYARRSISAQSGSTIKASKLFTVHEADKETSVGRVEIDRSDDGGDPRNIPDMIELSDGEEEYETSGDPRKKEEASDLIGSTGKPKTS